MWDPWIIIFCRVEKLVPFEITGMPRGGKVWLKCSSVCSQRDALMMPNLFLKWGEVYPRNSERGNGSLFWPLVKANGPLVNSLAGLGLLKSRSTLTNHHWWWQNGYYNRFPSKCLCILTYLHFNISGPQRPTSSPSISLWNTSLSRQTDSERLQTVSPWSFLHSLLLF